MACFSKGPQGLIRPPVVRTGCFHSWSLGSIPGCGTRIVQALLHSQRKKSPPGTGKSSRKSHSSHVFPSLQFSSGFLYVFREESTRCNEAQESLWVWPLTSLLSPDFPGPQELDTGLLQFLKSAKLLPTSLNAVPLAEKFCLQILEQLVPLHS